VVFRSTAHVSSCMTGKRGHQIPGFPFLQTRIKHVRTTDSRQNDGPIHANKDSLGVTTSVKPDINLSNKHDTTSEKSPQ
jgi:hypothetical protein